jgi:hypothetical protein
MTSEVEPLLLLTFCWYLDRTLPEIVSSPRRIFVWWGIGIENW